MPAWRHGWLPVALSLLALPPWAAAQTGHGGAAAHAGSAAPVNAVNRDIRRRSNELIRLHRQVGEQEAKSRAADARLREQDRAIEALRRQLRQVQPTPAPAKPPPPGQ